ncbi:PAS domain S-box protein [Evansella sp. AB-rgal1]|uniref:PAS domain S-box protein n=1 Tax=Evansella sp. AB-rgal1 TaxID=3242696 RepID=UPI00359EB587
MLNKLFEKNKEDFVTFIDCFRDAIFVMRVMNNSFYYVMMNQAGMQLAGLSKSDLNKEISSAIPGEIASFLKERYMEVTQRKTQIQYEDDSMNGFVGETMLTPIFAESGEVDYIIAVTRDITERKKELVKLKVNEQRYESLVQLNSDAIFSLDLEGNFLTLNKAGEVISGYKVEELLFKTFLDIIAEKDKDKSIARFKGAIRGEQQKYELTIIHKEGPHVQCLVKNIPIFVDNDVVGIYGIARDITVEKRMYEAIKESEERYSDLVNQSPDPIFIHQDGFIQYCNTAAVRLLEASGLEQLFGKSIYDFSTISYKKKVRERNEQLLKEKKVVKDEEQIITINGKSIDVEVTTILIHYKGKQAIHSIVRDITERKQLEKDLKRSEELYRLIAENSTDIIQLLTTEGKVVYASPSHKRVLRINPSDFLDKHLKQFVYHEDEQKLIDSFNRIKNVQTIRSEEARFYHAYRNTVWLRYDMIPIFDTDNKIESILFVGEDITARKKYEEKIHYMAYHDALTELPNRSMFSNRLKKAMVHARKNGTQVAIMYLDCDNFKPINDELGHDAGDVFLKSFAFRLKNCLRETDLIARIGGDEFNVLLEHIESEAEVTSVAQRILEEAEKPWEYSGVTYYVTCSIGIAMYPKDGEEIDTLIKVADEALYDAKKRGKNMFSKR